MLPTPSVLARFEICDKRRSGLLGARWRETDSGSAGTGCVIPSPTDRVVGNCGVFPGRTGSDEPEIGYLIDPPFRGQHYATEAAREVLAVARTCGIERLWATVRPGNKASLRILAALGFVEHHRTEDDQGSLIYLMSSGAAQQRPSPSLV